MNELTRIKVIFIFVLLVAVVLFGIATVYYKGFSRNKKLISFANCFAAGIFLLVGLMHLLGEGQESFVEALEEEIPVGYAVTIGGYIMVLFIEKMIFSSHSHTVDESAKNKSPDKSPEKVGRGAVDPLNGDFQPNNPEHECENVNCPVTSPPHLDSELALPGIILTCALVVHSIFEGIAVGVLKDYSAVVILCVAILIHNIPASVALGVKLIQIKKTLAVFLMGLFALSSPLGIAIGIAISNLNYPIIEAIFLCISAGTFLYIGCTEILAEEFESKDFKWLKFSGFLVGVIPLALFSIFIH